MTSVEAGSVSGPAFIAPGLPDDAQLWIVRHGETEWSASGQHTSITDLPLTEAGEKQAAALRSLLADVHPVLVLSSPRKRAVDTARLAGLEVDEVTEDLAEWYYGEYEGRTTAEIRAEVPNWSIWTHGAPDGETAAQIEARADRVLTRAAERLPEGSVVLVGHGHFSRALGARWIELPVSGGAHLLLGTAAPSILGAQYGASVIVRWNLPNPAV
ncbi:MAG: Phosphoglycerate mutase [Jatrophihabitans sp.]|nr:Phosphoglycerate mutase [Jatrophihabitans sp.]